MPPIKVGFRNFTGFRNSGFRNWLSDSETAGVVFRSYFVGFRNQSDSETSLSDSEPNRRIQKLLFRIQKLFCRLQKSDSDSAVFGNYIIVSRNYSVVFYFVRFRNYFVVFRNYSLVEGSTDSFSKTNPWFRAAGFRVGPGLL